MPWWLLGALLCSTQILAAAAQTASQPAPLPAADPNGIAGDVASAPPPPQTATATWLGSPATAIDELGPAVGAQRLRNLRGGTDSSESIVVVDGDVSGNTAEGVFSGSNLIDNGFNQASGISTVIQNTGSNVLIQNGMALNVQFTAPVP
ncbi:hypothetical protein ABB29_05280 [Pseudoxanthomonas dokdonensis]|uniref:Holdfast attachment protein HfaA n=2 Tax=Pseudoxanthomonas dokdonensis TaxID=344882 RepID=A0A0R0CLS6_9GAMM|nr:hypothetical protein ABB29_05280 [Pseudoxanthomonas dokdonensis]